MYRQFRPVAALQPFVHCFWAMKGNIENLLHPERLVPDGNIELILNFGGPFLRSGSEEHRMETYHGSCLVGQRSSYYFTSALHTIDVIGISFLPGGLSLFINEPVADFTDATISVDELKHPVFAEIEERVYAEESLH